jgi:predicted Ser/Thr protein kinase
MSEALFRRLGPYEIRRRIGGGNASVYLAEDTRAAGHLVALKVVANGPDDDARETAEAEQRGAELQRQWLAGSGFVPQVYEIGTAPGYLYIAMEYLEGEDLAARIRRGPIPAAEASAIARRLCEFLEEIDHLDLGTGTTSPLTLLHNDLKPTNVRLLTNGDVKVLDFGAAKALSMSRRVTRNDFYSTPYLSPECLESGERDRQTDAWALGVILYEMVAGRTPFRADDTRRLEDRIRSRRPPDPPADCPRGLRAVIAKLLAPEAADRYDTPEAIRVDLERFEQDTATVAEQEGWPDRVVDEPPTRRVRTPVDEPATRRVRSAATPAPTPQIAGGATTPVAAPMASQRRWVRTALILLVLSFALNEACVVRRSQAAAARVPMQSFSGLPSAWDEYNALHSQSLIGVSSSTLKHALTRQTLILADRVAANYRTPAPTVREAQWKEAAAALERAVAVEPTDNQLRGTLRYAQGQLDRIDGEADRARHQTASAQRHFAEAVSAFREAASLRPQWPDPFLGLARTFIYGLDDIDRGADALTQAQKFGFTLGARETAQLADGYRVRAEALWRAAAGVAGLPQEREMWGRARDAYQAALDQYSRIPDQPDAPAQIRAMQNRVEIVNRKIQLLEPRPAEPEEPAAATIVAPKRGAARFAESTPWA